MLVVYASYTWLRICSAKKSQKHGQNTFLKHLNLDCRPFLSLDCGTFLNLDCGTFLNFDCGPFLKLNCESLLNLDCGSFLNLECGTFLAQPFGHRLKYKVCFEILSTESFPYLKSPPGRIYTFKYKATFLKFTFKFFK